MNERVFFSAATPIGNVVDTTRKDSYDDVFYTEWQEPYHYRGNKP